MGFSRLWLTMAKKNQGTSPSNPHDISNHSKGGKRQVSAVSATCLRQWFGTKRSGANVARGTGNGSPRRGSSNQRAQME